MKCEKAVTSTDIIVVIVLLICIMGLIYIYSARLGQGAIIPF